jgi:hypothetical protein
MSDELHSDQTKADESVTEEQHPRGGADHAVEPDGTVTPDTEAEVEAVKQAEIAAQVAEGAAEEDSQEEPGLDDEPIDAVSLAPVAAPPTPPTSPAPSIVQHPVAVEPLSGPVAVTSADRITNPIGKRGKRAAERAARGRQLTP